MHTTHEHDPHCGHAQNPAQPAHSHRGHGHHHGLSPGSRNKGRLALVLGLTTLFMLVEVATGIYTNSLALLADAAHMLTDAGGLALALFAIWFAEKPATPERTYGYHRAEILAALANAVVLLGISGLVLYEAYQRFRSPPTVNSKIMLAVAASGLLVNVGGLALLHGGSRESLNLKGAYNELLSDAITSVGVLLAAAIMWGTGWYYVDPLISVAIGLFIVPRTWRLLSEAVGILLEGTPADVNLTNLRASLEKLPGVAGVHDLHVWTLTSGVYAMSLHAVLKDDAVHEAVIRTICDHARSTYKITHTTVQVERAGCSPADTHI
jgi:cobalt-zinc-cadmium efflux system protein